MANGPRRAGRDVAPDPRGAARAQYSGSVVWLQLRGRLGHRVLAAPLRQVRAVARIAARRRGRGHLSDRGSLHQHREGNPAVDPDRRPVDPRTRRARYGVAPMPVEIRQVRGLRDLREFVALPYRLHAGTPWIPPLKLERYLFLLQPFNAYFKHADAGVLPRPPRRPRGRPDQRAGRPRLQRVSLEPVGNVRLPGVRGGPGGARRPAGGRRELAAQARLRPDGRVRWTSCSTRSPAW